MGHLVASQQPSKWRCAMHFMYYSTRMLCATHSCRTIAYVLHNVTCTYPYMQHMQHLNIYFTYVTMYCTYIACTCQNISVHILYFMYMFPYNLHVQYLRYMLLYIAHTCDIQYIFSYIEHACFCIFIYILTMHISMEIETHIMYAYIHAPSIHHI